jgi:3-phosphoshikimate 1-carboxyvinyltransferase
MSLDGFRPGGALQGDLYVPCSKSIAQRVLVCSALAKGRTHLAPMLLGEDGTSALAAIQAAGAAVTREGEDLLITGSSLAGGLRATGDVDVGESGTMARLMTAALAFNGTSGRKVRVCGSGSIARRRSPALFAALRAAGVEIEFEGEADGWPVRIGPIEPPSDMLLTDPSSSQEVSGLLIALAGHAGTHRLTVHGSIPSSGYVDMTCRVLAALGVRTDLGQESPGTQTFEVRGALRESEERLRIVEPDASAAAVALAAGCLSGGSVRVPGLGPSSWQADKRIVEHLQEFGCTAGADEGALYASGLPVRGVDLDLSATPDLAPVIAALAGAVALSSEGSSVLSGLGTLPGKESSRIEVLASGLSALGLHAVATADSLGISPGNPVTGVVELDPHGDHRMAFAFGLLSLFRDGIRVKDPTCVAKSWPAFWDELERSGARRG